VGRAQLWDIAAGSNNNPVAALLVDRDGEKPAEKSVWSVAVSPDGSICATGSGDKTAQLWDVATRKPIGPALVHESRVVALAFSPDSRLLATGSTDKTVRLWLAASGRPVGEPLDNKGAVWAVAFSRDGRFLVTGSRDGAGRIWDVATGLPIGPALTHKETVWAVAGHPRDEVVLTGGGDGKIRLWPLPQPLTAKPEQVTLWVQVITGRELDETGKVRWLDADSWAQRRQRLHPGELPGT
jgi:WD40 repeat protein